MGETEIKIIIYTFNVFFILFIIAYVIFFRQYVIKKKEYENKVIIQQEKHKKALLNTEIEIQRQTMTYIGQEIHDNIGQKITLASLNIQRMIMDKDNKNQEPLNNINDILNESLATLRSFSKSLTDNHIESMNFYELIEEEILKINGLKQLKIVSDFEENIDMNYQQKVVLFRITQEFIQNSIKHAKCKNILISLKQVASEIYYDLTDDGIGFNISKSLNRGIGLSNMEQRIQLLGGHIEFYSEPNKGTLVKIIIPQRNET